MRRATRCSRKHTFFSASARLEVEAESYYDSASLSVKVSYKRPETSEEESGRKSRDKARQDSIKDAELEEIARLRRKHGV